MLHLYGRNTVYSQAFSFVGSIATGSTSVHLTKYIWKSFQKYFQKVPKKQNLNLLHASNYQYLYSMEKAMATHSSTLAWKIPWTEEPGRLQSMGSLRVGHDWTTSLSLFTFMHWRRKWQPTPVFLPGESQGRGSLVGCPLWGCTESDTTEVTQHIHLLRYFKLFSEVSQSCPTLCNPIDCSLTASFIMI